MSDQKSEKDIVKKLDKVADSLETTTSHLSSVVTQQQLDLIRERIAKCESEIVNVRDSMTSSVEKSSAILKECLIKLTGFEKLCAEFERDLSASRALTFSSFALSTVAVIGLVICTIYL